MNSTVNDVHVHVNGNRNGDRYKGCYPNIEVLIREVLLYIHVHV